jgi:membrane protein DedA with SNARE-associated domain
MMSFLGFNSGSKGWTSKILSISILVSILGMLAGIILEYLIGIYSNLSLPYKD